MADRVIITWSFENWITISTMAVVGFAVLALVSQSIIAAKSNG